MTSQHGPGHTVIRGSPAGGGMRGTDPPEAGLPEAAPTC